MDGGEWDGFGGDRLDRQWDAVFGGFMARDFSFRPAFRSAEAISQVPQALLDLVQHPERIHVRGDVEGNQLEVYLTIDPANPTGPPVDSGQSGSDPTQVHTPEPASLAMWAVVLGGGAVWCRRRLRQGK